MERKPGPERTQMARHPKATSNDGKALADVRAGPLQPPWPLSKQQKTVWAEILIAKSRDEWNPVDLRFAFELAGVLVELHEQEVKLDLEGAMIEGRNGPKLNPRGRIVDQLARRSASLARYLRIHPGANGYEPSIVNGRRRTEQEARELLARDDDWRPKH
jgi:hypothetical protein